MTVQITDDFIAIIDDAHPEHCLNDWITYFDTNQKLKLVYNREASIMKHIIDDQSINLVATLCTTAKNILEPFLETFWEKCFTPYIDKFSVLNNAKYEIIDAKIQKTLPGNGYHIWHYENASNVSRTRMFAFMVYLNTVEEGGETEFLYLKKRIKPVKNRTLIWPAGFTHTHRGNQPLSGEKYIVTGWIERFDE